MVLAIGGSQVGLHRAAAGRFAAKNRTGLRRPATCCWQPQCGLLQPTVNSTICRPPFCPQVLPLAQALALARSMGLDLVEVPGTRNPLVAKIVDYEAQAAAQRKVGDGVLRCSVEEAAEVGSVGEYIPGSKRQHNPLQTRSPAVARHLT